MPCARLAALAVLLACVSQAVAQPDEGHVDRPDVKLHYTSVGVGKPLVILGGGPGQDVRQLAGIYNDIKDLRRCVLLDQRATGRSRLAKLDQETVNLDRYVEDLEALRKSLKLEKLSLLGHSWGSMLALAYGVKYPRRVDDLILVSSGPIAIERLRQAGDVLEHRRALINVQGELKEGQDLYELRPFFFDQKKAVEFARRPREGEVATPVSQYIIPDLFRRNFDLRSGAKAIRANALIIQGRHDAMPESFVIEMQNSIPRARLSFIEKAGHFPWIEQPAAFSAVLRDYLKGQSR
jgi:proline iminopeptidase